LDAARTRGHILSARDAEGDATEIGDVAATDQID
jgi:hypothetical protein